MSLLNTFIDAELQLPPTVVASLPQREIWIAIRLDGPADPPVVIVANGFDLK
jgi:hypothetical protein